MWIVTLLLAALCLTAPLAAQAQQLTLPTPAHRRTAPEMYNRMLVRLPQSSPDVEKQLQQAELVLHNAGLHFNRSLQRNWSIWHTQTPLDRTTLAALQSALQSLLPNALVQPNRRYYRSNTPTDPDYGKQWALENSGQLLAYPADSADDEDPSSGEDKGTLGMDIGLEQAWNYQADAEGVVVAVLDSGLATDTQDLDSLHIAAGYDFCENDNDPDDDVGHGTAIAGLLAATHNNNLGIVGAAPRVSIMPLRFIGNRFPSETECTQSDPPATCDCNYTTAAIAAIDYAMTHGADILNMSFGGPDEDPALRDALEAAVEAGIFLVAAAGNESLDLDQQPSYPASFEIDGMLSVGSHTNSGHLSSFSNYGSVINLAAPGSTIWLPNPHAVDRFNFDHFDDLPDSAGVIDNTYRMTMGTYSDFSLDANGRWGIATLTTGGKVAVLDVDKALRGENGYSAASAGTWTSGAIAVNNQTQIRAEIFAELAGDDYVVLELSRDNTNWTPVVVVEETFGAPIEVPMEEIFPGTTSQVYVRIRPEISQGSTAGIPGGLYITGVRLWERSSAEDAELDAFSYIQGTSFAAPYVSAVAALMRAQIPALSPRALAARITASAATLTDTDGRIPMNRRLDAAAALNPNPRLFVPGTNRFRHVPYFPSQPKSGELTEFRVSYVDPLTRPVPDSITLQLRAPAHDFSQTLELNQVVTAATDHYYEYAAVYTFAQDDTWQYDTSVTLADGLFIQGPAGEIAVQVGRNNPFPTVTEESPTLHDAGCGCTVIRDGKLAACPLTPAPGISLLSGLLLWLLGWISLRNRPNGSDLRA